MQGSCAGHFGYNKVTHRYPRKYWLPANSAIEAAYPNKKGVFFGSQFVQGAGFGTQLPRGFGGMTAREIDLWNKFLDGFRGLENQLQPDIIDFNNRVFYEIKTEKFVVEGRRQLMGYHKLAAELTSQLGLPPFDAGAATWYPPAVMVLPGGPNKLICTEMTNHQSTPAGLLLYSIWKKVEDEEDDEESAASAVTLQDLAPILRDSRAKIANELRQPKNYQTSGDYEIIAPAALWDSLMGQAQMQRTIQALSTPSRQLTHNYAFLARLAGAAAGVPSTVLGLGIIIGIASAALLEGAVVGGVGVGGLASSGGAATVGTTVTVEAITAADAVLAGSGGSTLTAAQLARIGAVAANDNLIPLARAAGVLIVLSIATKASASELTVNAFGAIRLARAEDVYPNGAYSDGRPVTYRGEKYVTVGRGTVL